MKGQTSAGENARLLQEISLLNDRIREFQLSEAERKIAEDRREAALQDLRESEELLRITLQSIGDAVMATDLSGCVTRMNAAAETLTGWPLAEAKGKPLSEVFHIVNAITLALVDNPVDLVMKTLRVVGLANHTMLIARDGRTFQIMDSAAPILDDEGTIRGVILVFSDVTEKYAVQDALRQSEERWQFALEGAGDGVWDRNVTTDEVFFSPQWKALIGYEDHEIINSVDEWARRIHPEDKARCYQALEEHFSGRTPLYINEYRLQCKDGTYKWILARGKVVERDGDGAPRRFIGVHTDITDRKQAEFEREEALAAAREHARLQKRHMETLSELIASPWLHESDGTSGIMTITEAAAEILNTERTGIWFYNEDYTTMTCRDLYEASRDWHSSGEVLRSSEFPEYTASHAMGQVIVAEDVYSDPRTTHVPANYYNAAGITSLIGAPIWVKGRLAAVLSCEHVGPKRSWLPEDEQTALTLAACVSNHLEGIERQRSEEKYRAIYENALEGIFQSTPEGTFLSVNPAFARMTGYESPEILTTSITNIEQELYLNPGDRLQYREILEREGFVTGFETALRKKNGGVVYVNLNSRVVCNSQGGILYYEGTAEDITARKEAEFQRKAALEALRISEERYRSILNSMQESYYEVDLKGNLTFFNLTAMMRLGYPDRDLRGMNFTKFAEKKSVKKIFRAYKRVYTSGKPVRGLEWELATRDGTKIPVEGSISLIRDAAGEPAGFRGVVRDISDRKQAEAERKQAVEALRKSEKKYRLVVENANDIIWTFDLASMAYTFVSPSLERVCGYSVENALTMKLKDIHPPGSLQRLSKTYEELIAGKSPRDRVLTEAEHYTADGGVMWTEISARLMRDNQGKAFGISGTTRDITDRKQAEAARERAVEALGRNEEKYRLVVENANDIIWTFDLASMAYTFISPSAERLYGLPAENIQGMKMEDHFPPATMKTVSREFGRLMAGEIPGDRLIMEAEHNTPDGSDFWMEISATSVKDETGRITGFSGVSRDITGRKRAEKEREQALQALQVSEERYRAAFRTSPDAISITRLSDGMRFDTNEGFTRMTGYTREESVGRTSLELETWHDPRDRETFVSVLREQGHVNNLEASFRMKDGRITTGLLSASLLTINGEPYIQTVTRDITEMKEIEAQREAEREQRLELERRLSRAQKLESVGTLAGGIAHDFNNLLMGIQGYVSLMMLDLDSSHPHYTRLKHVEEQVTSGANLTKQLLGFAQGGRYEVKPSSINEILTKTAAMFGRTKKEIAIHKTMEENLWTVEVDRTQMEQVFMNLYVNAWQAMAGGGELYLVTENVVLDTSRTEPFEREPGRYVKISVTDTGMGMDGKTRERIFDPFFSTKAMGRGTGLGLATVYGIIRGHKGMINVYSEPGRGTTFSLYLPASEKNLVENSKTAEPDFSVLRGTETILLVDDEAMVLDVSRELLESLGYKVYVAGGGQEAVALYTERKDEIDLVILDMIMPGISGSGAFDRLREINPRVRVLLSSGYSINGEAKNIMDRGCDAFLQKPFQLPALSRKVRELLG